MRAFRIADQWEKTRQNDPRDPFEVGNFFSVLATADFVHN
jgi:hypothetical protein